MFTPPPTTFRDSKPTLLVSWWCTLYAIAIIIIRVCGRYVRAEKIFMEDGVMMLAVTPLLVRMAFVHLVLVDGTGNVDLAGYGELGMSGEEERRRIMGSQLVLGGRVFYAASLWAIKYSTTLFLRTLTTSIPTYTNLRSTTHLHTPSTPHQTSRKLHKRIKPLDYLHAFLLLTFLGTVVADLAACQPFPQAWQVIPSPSTTCRNGSIFTWTMGILNIVTNIALVAFPLPVIWRSKVSRGQKFSILILLFLPMLSVGYTAYTLWLLPRKGYAQQSRSLYASIDILLAAFVSNSVVLFSLLKGRGYKKEKYRGWGVNGAGGVLDRDGEGAGGGGRKGSAQVGFAARKGSEARGVSRWGSDEDLMEGIGFGGGGGGGNDNNIKMKDMDGTGHEKNRSVVSVGEVGGGGVGRGGSGSIRVKSFGSGGVTRPEEVRLGDIRVASSWEIRVDDKV